MDMLDFALSILMITIVISACYLVLIRPQSRRLHELRRMIAGLRPGDQIVSAGGLVGTVVGNANSNNVEVEIAKGVRVFIRRNLINDVVSQSNDEHSYPFAARTAARVTVFSPLQ